MNQDHVHGPECTKTVQHLADRGERMLAKIYTERDKFVSDSDLMDVADELAPIDYEYDGYGNLVNIAYDEQLGKLTGFDADYVHMVHLALLNELDARVADNVESGVW